MARYRDTKLRIRAHKVVHNRSAGGDFGIFFVLLIFGAFLVLPLWYKIIESFKPLDELFEYPPKFYVMNPTTENYVDLFSLMSNSWVPMSRYLFNTIYLTAFGIIGNLIGGSLAAYALSKINFPGRKTFFKLVVNSMMISATVSGVASFIIISALGWMDSHLAIIIPAFGGAMGVYLMKQFMDSSIPAAVLESARLDGASEFRIFLTIAMPMVKPAWLTLMITCFQSMWGLGASPYIHSEQLKTFPYAMSQILAGGVERSGASAAASVIMMIVPALVFIINQSKIVETMGASGMKD